VMMDVFGSIGYFAELKSLAPSLGRKMKASNMPVIVMAGVAAELKPATLAVPGRDPRATMNAIYHKSGVQAMLDLAQENDIPLLFVSNNVCNEMLKFEDADEVIKELDLEGLMADLARAWYGPHLEGKCVPFDWVSFLAMLLYDRFEHSLALETRDLYVGINDASILVLHDKRIPMNDISKGNLEGTQSIPATDTNAAVPATISTKLWGPVHSVVSVNRQAMIELCSHLCQLLRVQSKALELKINVQPLLDLRNTEATTKLKGGKCLYIQAGDSAEFDSYFVSCAAAQMQLRTENMALAIVVPERIANNDSDERDPMKHDPEYSKQVMDTAGRLLTRLVGQSTDNLLLVKGSRNTKNVIAHKFMFNEVEKYGPLINDRSE
jgi:hypothetical protein